MIDTSLYKVNTGTRGGRLLHLVLELNKSCFWCIKKVKLGKYEKEKGLASLLGSDFLHHVKSTHGLDPDIVFEYFNSYLDDRL